MNSVTGIPVLQNYFNGISVNPVLLFIVIIVIIIYLILFGSLGSGNYNETSGSSEMRLLTIILIGLFIVLVIINGFNHFLNIDIITRIKNFFTRTPEIDIMINNLDDNVDHENDNDNNNVKSHEEVYHIPGNVYNFNNARALCKAYGGRLANYEDVQKAYDKGGEWCSYGWSEDQMALFPTQLKTWNKLQKVKGHENDCGRPGINGGFIDNPNVRFGVNCFGPKPKITPLEAQLMKNNKEFPITVRSQEFQKKVEYWKSRIGDIMVSPFNRTTWSRF